MSIEIALKDPWVSRVLPEGGSQELPVSSLKNDGSHLHGELLIVVDGEPIPRMGYFGPRDVCVTAWVRELRTAARELRSSASATLSGEGAVVPSLSLGPRWSDSSRNSRRYSRMRHLGMVGPGFVPCMKVPDNMALAAQKGDTAAIRALRDTPAMAAVEADEARFIDRSTMGLIIADDHVAKPGPALPGMAKGLEFVRRKPGMPVGAFQRHWQEVHGPLVPRFRDCGATYRATRG
jgi:hypothetical protein